MVITLPYGGAEETRTPDFLRGKSGDFDSMFKSIRFSSTLIPLLNFDRIYYISIWFVNKVILTNILSVEIMLLTDAVIMEQT